jgi:hypothetical protein
LHSRKRRPAEESSFRMASSGSVPVRRTRCIRWDVEIATISDYLTCRSSATRTARSAKRWQTAGDAPIAPARRACCQRCRPFSLRAIRTGGDQSSF